MAVSAPPCDSNRCSRVQPSPFITDTAASIAVRHHLERTVGPVTGGLELEVPVLDLAVELIDGQDPAAAENTHD